jgi:SAM-dependent methyltransferase
MSESSTGLRADQRQHAHRELWARKPVLREVYGHLYRRMAAACVPGLTIEVGGGSGNMREFAPDVLSFDIVHEPWLDFVADAQALPLAAGCASNVVMFDVLHHIQYPVRFLRESARVLRPGGRLVFVEPGITPVSSLFYRLFHEEPVDMSVDPLADGSIDRHKDPYDSNQALPTLLVTRHRRARERAVPELQELEVRWLSLFAYPLSGGFKPWSLLTPALARALLGVEDRLERSLGRLLAFRTFAVFERIVAAPQGGAG